MTTENLLSELPFSHKQSPSTTPRLSNSKYGIRQAKRDISRLHQCTTGMQIVQSSFTILHKPYVRGESSREVLLTGSQSSLDKAKSWVKELQRQANENIIIALAGNKLDLVTEHPDKRAITTADAEAYAREAGLLFFETSAKTAENVRELFTAIARKLPLEQAGNRGMRANPRQGVDLRPEAPGTQGGGACNC